MPRAFLVRVATDIEIAQVPATALWIAVADTGEEALEAVRSRVGPQCEVELSDAAVPQETVERLGLDKGEVWHI
jgi:hypothetical protein